MKIFCPIFFYKKNRELLLVFARRIDFLLEASYESQVIILRVPTAHDVNNYGHRKATVQQTYNIRIVKRCTENYKISCKLNCKHIKNEE